MPNASFAVSQYYASLHAPDWRGSAAMIAVSDGANSVVFFWFAPPGQAATPPNLSGSGGEVWLASEAYPAFIDLLRNEEPVYCSYTWGTQDDYARIGTAAEPPGEGE